jgi:hypothetical protein
VVSKVFLISVIDFYYVINKLIILVLDSHQFNIVPPFKVTLNRYISVFNH